jgi:hypothetical protein
MFSTSVVIVAPTDPLQRYVKAYTTDTESIKQDNIARTSNLCVVILFFHLTEIFPIFPSPNAKFLSKVGLNFTEKSSISFRVDVGIKFLNKKLVK